MKVLKTEIPIYQITLSAEEIGWLWSLAYNAYHDHGVKNAHYFYDKLEDIRPAGGFDQPKDTNIHVK